VVSSKPGARRCQESSPHSLTVPTQALDEYWALLGKFEVGLSQKDVAYWVGAIFRTLLNTQRNKFRVSPFPLTGQVCFPFADIVSSIQACNPKILATIQALGGEKVQKVEGWIAKTEDKFTAALKAAGA